ncbi:FAD-binding oxidoreductase, partial [Haloferax sp. Atlit-12N]|uniref:FAD-binding oxidoreductase n=1 Tax=Haloferax sp. Atlit-12N TaxID=2077203 RepID=UPI0011E5F3D7
MIDTQNYELRQLAQELEGELDFSEATCTLYSTDASIYQQVPSGVAFPKTAADVQSLVEFASENNISVTPRGAGSSLTGNAIGEGLVIDSERYMDSIVQISPDKRQVTVEPGVILEDLNEELEEYGLQFGPNPSTSATCTIGGMVANDAAGPHSLRYGTTSENVVSVGVVLSDGTIGKFTQKSGSTLEQACTRDDLVGEVYQSLREIRTTHSDEIHKRYPEVDRNSTGYNLRDCGADDGQWVDPSTVISGSEGTLCYLTEITLSLDPLPEAKGTALLFYRSLEAAADAVSVLLEESPSAIELVDDAVLEYARDAWGYDLVPDEVGGALLVEVEGPQASISDRLTTVVDAGTATFSEDIIEVHQAESEEQRQVLWKIRKASNPLLNRQPGDQQALSFIEDAAIPPSKLPQYLDAVGTILQSHELRASVFGHAGQGVLHIKPFLNLKSEEDRKTL